MSLALPILCSAQALLLTSTKNRVASTLFQVASPLLDNELVDPPNIPNSAVIKQSMLYIGSIFLPILANEMSETSGNNALNVLLKLLSPLVYLAIERIGDWNKWAICISSYIGFLIAMDFNWSTVSHDFWVHVCLWCGVICGVLLGIEQKTSGPCFRQITKIGTIFFALCFITRGNQTVGIDCILMIPLSFLVQRTVRNASKQFQHCPYQLSIALNRGRALTVILGSFYTPKPLQTLFGGLIAIFFSFL